MTHRSTAIADATHTYFYDAESRLIQVGGTLGNCIDGYGVLRVHDAEGQRLEKLTGGTTTAYLRDTEGEVVAETDGGNTLLRAGYVYAGGAPCWPSTKMATPTSFTKTTSATPA